MDLKHSYFSITSPLSIIDRWLNPYTHSSCITLRDKKLKVNWTNRADNALSKQQQPLLAELQLYFSCVVKKRVLFPTDSAVNAIRVTPKLNIIFRTVQASSCSPEEFASEYPVNHEYTSEAANRMCPTQLYIDYINHQWTGSFNI